MGIIKALHLNRTYIMDLKEINPVYSLILSL